MRKFLLVISTFLFCAANGSAQSFETATQAVTKMGPGWNLGNTLDAHGGKRMEDVVQSETTWGQPVTKPELMRMMKEAGFGAIRVPVTWYPHMNDAGVVDAAWMKRVHEVVDYVINEGMYCILNVHHDTGADSNYSTSWLKADETIYNNVRQRYENLWRQIANEFKCYGDKLLFESYNEMLDVKNSWCFASFAAPGQYNASIATSAYNAINSYAQSFVDVVRSTGGNNAQRNLVVNTYGSCSGGGTWNQHLKDPLKELKYPNDPAGKGHIIFQVHSYPSLVENNRNRSLASIKSEIDDMVNAWNTHLVSKGAPVILGEWGTSNVDAAVTDYDARRELMFQFCEYLVKKCKDNKVGTFLWMGLTDGSYRSLPAFTQPDLAECIAKAYHGSTFEGVYPTINDFEVAYLVKYNGDWQELNLVSAAVSLSQYKGIRVELGEVPAQGAFQIKCYGEGGKEQYIGLVASSPVTTATFNRSTLGNTVSRVTLQTMKGAQEVTLKRAFLIKNDNTEVELKSFNPYWGCTVEMISVPLGVDAPAVAGRSGDERIFNLQGQQVDVVTVPGIYIKGGKKVYVGH
ncbi:MAG: glycoside hydrolase family 5 protein [Bacteroidaceae bacterium]|nr:glycoside hydrolase family 5 protein [Bacteroidaceae bacterium]